MSAEEANGDVGCDFSELDWRTHYVGAHQKGSDRIKEKELRY